jgi:hypothetical protein
MSWSASLSYRRTLGERPEMVYAKNLHGYPGRDGQQAAAPAADKPDF